MGAIRKIIVADDENIQRNVLARLVKRLTPDADVISCANGAEVLRRMEETSVQLVLTDIRMPEVDGMELISALAERYPQTKLVLISAYQEFSYAQQAIRCQVMDYLVKPFRKADVERLLERAEQELRDDMEREAVPEKEKEQYRQRLRRLLSGMTQEDDEKLLVPLEVFGTIALLEWSGQKLGEPGENFLYRELLPLCSGVQIVSSGDAENRFFAWLPQLSAELAAEDLTKLSAAFIQKDIPLWIGLSTSCGNLRKETAQAAEQAREALSYRFYLEEGRVLLYDRIAEASAAPLPSTQGLEKELLQASIKGEYHTLSQILQQFQELFSPSRAYSPMKVKRRMTSITMGILREMEDVLRSETCERLLDRISPHCLRCSSRLELFDTIRRTLFEAAEQYVGQVQNFDAVNACVTYIEDHLTEDLSLVSVAERLHFHPNYLSALLKRKTGLSYSGFLQQIRMKKAQSMLMQSDQKVQVIAAECGFRDVSYFNRVFKKEFELSPEQYRRLHHEKKDR